MSKAKKTVKAKESTEEAPTGDPIVSLSVIGGKEGWSLVKTTTVGDKIVEQEISPPDLRAVAIERFKITAATLYMGV